MALAIEECLCGLFSSEFTFILKLTKLDVTSPHIPPQRHRTSRAGWSSRTPYKLAGSGVTRSAAISALLSHELTASMSERLAKLSRFEPG